MKMKIFVFYFLSIFLANIAHADTYLFSTDSFANSTNSFIGLPLPGAHAESGSLRLTYGQTFTVNTDTLQMWSGASFNDGNYSALHTNADGVKSGWTFDLPGLSGVHVGTLVADINGEYRVIGAGERKMSAWGSGELIFHYADINSGDNLGTIHSTVTTVPEPKTFILMLLGLVLIRLLSLQRLNSADDNKIF